MNGRAPYELQQRQANLVLSKVLSFGLLGRLSLKDVTRYIPCQSRPIRELRHINLVRHEAVNYQSHDAFARVAMSFGTNQLLFAICYYTLGPRVDPGLNSALATGTQGPTPIFCGVLLTSIAEAYLVQDYMGRRQSLLL
eukprot:6193091-Amphidinium_carterae.1